MRKYYDNLDDYTDTRPSRLMEWWKWFMPRLIAVWCALLVLAYCAHLEAM